MKAKQLYFVLLAVVIILVLGFIGVGYGADRLLGSRAANLSKLRADQEVADGEQIALNRNKADITKYHDLNTVAQTIVPQDKDQAEAVRQIVNLAQQSGMPEPSSITLPSSTLGAAGAGTDTDPNLTQLTQVDGMTGVYQLPITVTQAVDNPASYKAFLRFLAALEQNRRTAQVSTITLTPDPGDPSEVSFVLVINEFIKPS